MGLAVRLKRHGSCGYDVPGGTKNKLNWTNIDGYLPILPVRGFLVSMLNCKRTGFVFLKQHLSLVSGAQARFRGVTKCEIANPRLISRVGLWAMRNTAGLGSEDTFADDNYENCSELAEWWYLLTIQ